MNEDKKKNKKRKNKKNRNKYGVSRNRNKYDDKWNELKQENKEEQEEEEEEEKVLVIKSNGNDKEETGEVIMGWDTNKKYLLSLKTPNYPQLYIVVLDSMFVTSILRSKESKRQVKLSNFESKIVCTFSNTLQIVPLYPDMILIPNVHDIHAFLFTFQ